MKKINMFKDYEITPRQKVDKQCLIVLDGVFTLVILQSNHVLIYLNTLDQLIAGYGVSRFSSIDNT